MLTSFNCKHKSFIFIFYIFCLRVYVCGCVCVAQHACKSQRTVHKVRSPHCIGPGVELRLLGLVA